MSGYELFVRKNMARLKREKGVQNYQEAFGAASYLWNNLSQAEKDVYKNKAKIDPNRCKSKGKSGAAANRRKSRMVAPPIGQVSSEDSDSDSDIESEEKKKRAHKRQKSRQKNADSWEEKHLDEHVVQSFYLDNKDFDENKRRRDYQRTYFNYVSMVNECAGSKERLEALLDQKFLVLHIVVNEYNEKKLSRARPLPVEVSSVVFSMEDGIINSKNFHFDWPSIDTNSYRFDRDHYAKYDTRRHKIPLDIMKELNTNQKRFMDVCSSVSELREQMNTLEKRRKECRAYEYADMIISGDRNTFNRVEGGLAKMRQLYFNESIPLPPDAPLDIFILDQRCVTGADSVISAITNMCHNPETDANHGIPLGIENCYEHCLVKLVEKYKDVKGVVRYCKFHEGQIGHRPQLVRFCAEASARLIAFHLMQTIGSLPLCKDKIDLDDVKYWPCCNKENEVSDESWRTAHQLDEDEEEVQWKQNRGKKLERIKQTKEEYQPTSVIEGHQRQVKDSSGKSVPHTATEVSKKETQSEMPQSRPTSVIEVEQEAKDSSSKSESHTASEMFKHTIMPKTLPLLALKLMKARQEKKEKANKLGVARAETTLTDEVSRTASTQAADHCPLNKEKSTDAHGSFKMF